MPSLSLSTPPDDDLTATPAATRVNQNMLRRFYAPQIDDSPLELDPEQSRHAQRTLRLTPGAAVELFDGRGTVARAVVESLGKAMRLTIESRRRVEPLRPALTVAIAMPKGQRADALIEGLTQAGVGRIVPLRTERSVVEPGSGKQKRFERIAIEAAKQSGRSHLPTLDPPWDFDAFVEAAAEADGPRLITDTPGDGVGDASADGLQNVHIGQHFAPGGATLSSVKSVVVLVGPEGGWTDTERETARGAGFEAWCFNPCILRVETAGLIAAGLIRAAAMADPNP